jgi:hypothetical protein
MNRKPAVLHFHHGGTGMALALLSLIAFLTLTAWRCVFSGLRTRRLVREIDALQRHSSFLGLRLHIFDLAEAGVLAGYLENGSDGLDAVTRKYRAQSYLRRIVALTGATQMGRRYVLDVGTTRFEVRDRYVRRLRDLANPQCAYEETCFYLPHKEMPKSEQIATALLQLKNNPALFDGWAAQKSLALKADSQVFTRAQ